MTYYKKFIKENKEISSLEDIKRIVSSENISNDFKEASSKTLIIKTDSNRKQTMRKLESLLNGFKIDINLKGSSEGGLTDGTFKILVKPITKVKGAGGRAFENDFIEEFNKYCLDNTYVCEFTDIFKEILKQNNIEPEDLSGFQVIPEGKFNKKRPFEDIVTDSNSKNIGQTVTDVTLQDSNNKLYYLSLKIGKSFYLYNGGFTPFLNNEKLRRDFLSSLGVDYTEFDRDFSIKTADKYHPEINKNPNSKLARLIKNCLGFGYTMVHYNGSKSTVEYLKSEENLTASIVRYKPRGTSKFYAIDCIVSMLGKKYQCQIQIRNNAGGVTPNVIYVYFAKEL